MTEEEKIRMINTRPRPLHKMHKLPSRRLKKRKWYEKRMPLKVGEGILVALILFLIGLYFGANSAWLLRVMDHWMM